MSNVFKYSVLKYIHSQFLGEEINLGLIFQFPNPNRLKFKFSKNLARIKYFYNNADEKGIKQLLYSFEQKVNELNTLDIAESLEINLTTHFLVKDAAPFQFSDLQSVVQYDNDIEHIAEHYYQLYFTDLETIGQVRTIKDSQASITYRNLLIQKDKAIKKFLQPPIELKNEKARFKSDLVWKNGTINAVKGVSFDLKDESAISDKALLLNAKLNYLANEAIDKNIRFDILVIAPNQKDLLPAYKNALDVLTDIKTNKEIITEDQLEEYTLRTLREVDRL